MCLYCPLVMEIVWIIFIFVIILLMIIFFESEIVWSIVIFIIILLMIIYLENKIYVTPEMGSTIFEDLTVLTLDIWEPMGRGQNL